MGVSQATVKNDFTPDLCSTVVSKTTWNARQLYRSINHDNVGAKNNPDMTGNTFARQVPFKFNLITAKNQQILTIPTSLQVWQIFFSNHLLHIRFSALESDKGNFNSPCWMLPQRGRGNMKDFCQKVWKDHKKVLSIARVWVATGWWRKSREIINAFDTCLEGFLFYRDNHVLSRVIFMRIIRELIAQPRNYPIKF